MGSLEIGRLHWWTRRDFVYRARKSRLKDELHLFARKGAHDAGGLKNKTKIRSKSAFAISVRRAPRRPIRRFKSATVKWRLVIRGLGGAAFFVKRTKEEAKLRDSREKRERESSEAQNMRLRIALTSRSALDLSHACCENALTIPNTMANEPLLVMR